MLSEQAITAILVAFFGFLTTVAGLTAAYFTAKMKQSSDRSEGKLDHVVQLTNSNYTNLNKKLDDQTQIITDLKVLLATEKERQTPTTADGSVK